MEKPGEQEKLGISDFLFWLIPIEGRKWGWREFFWFPVETPNLARWSRGPALVFAGYASFMWTLYAIIGFFTPSVYGNWCVIFALVWILVAWGLCNMRLEAAIAGFILSLISIFWSTGSFEVIQAAVMIFMYFHAIRGTFAYQSFCKMEIESGTGQPQ